MNYDVKDSFETTNSKWPVTLIFAQFIISYYILFKINLIISEKMDIIDKNDIIDHTIPSFAATMMFSGVALGHRDQAMAVIMACFIQGSSDCSMHELGKGFLEVWLAVSLLI